jgi:hypothetical protein
MKRGNGKRVDPAAIELAAVFARCGYIRRFDADGRVRDGQSYKKGNEVRFVVASPAELRAVRVLLLAVGLRPGRAFQKHRRLVQPLYGLAAVEWCVAHLPAGRDRSVLGFSSNGQRVVRRSRREPRASAGTDTRRVSDPTDPSTSS